MRQKTESRVWRSGSLSLVLILAIGLAWGMQPALSDEAQGFSLTGVQVTDTPLFTYEIEEVAFPEPHNLSTGAGSARRLVLVKVTVRGHGFRPMATGPVVWLNGIPTLRTEVAEDGTTVEAYFLESLDELEGAAQGRRRWELLYQPHGGATAVQRISPTGDVGDSDQSPPIKELSLAEQQRVDALRRTFGIEENN